MTEMQKSGMNNMNFGYTKPDDYPECMYDRLTGLPSFNLFEDRLQMALTNEKAKNLRLRRLKIAVVGIKIENLASFAEGSARDDVIRQTARELVELLPENYTVARGINYQFWLMMPYLESREDGKVIIEKIKSTLAKPLSAAGGVYHRSCKMGAVLYEHNPADSVNTLVGKAIFALQRAEENGKGVVYFSELVNS